MDPKSNQIQDSLTSVAGELSTIVEAGISAVSDLPVDSILEGITEGAAVASESVGEVIGSILENL